MTSSRLHAVLFTKEACKPCELTKEHLYDVLENSLGLNETISVLKKENHSALVEAYQLNLYPTLLIVGPGGLEQERIVGGKAIREVLEEKLIHIYRENNA